MAGIKLQYRMTFIDVLEEQPAVTSAKRGRSLPAMLERPSRSEDMELNGYVTSLMQRSQQIPILARLRSQRTSQEQSSGPKSKPAAGDEMCSTNFSTTSTTLTPASLLSVAMAAPSTVAVEEALPLVNPGSAGHPELCRRPCIFHAQGKCGNGSSCTYCHVEHDQRTLNFDKRQREHLRSLSEAERLALVLPVLKEKAVSKALVAQTQELLDMLESRMRSMQHGQVSQAQSLSFQRGLAKLQKIMMKMPFSTLLGCATGGSLGVGLEMGSECTKSDGFQLKLREAVQRMQMRLVQEAQVEMLDIAR
jgi:hypothetical protein